MKQHIFLIASLISMIGGSVGSLVAYITTQNIVVVLAIVVLAVIVCVTCIVIALIDFLKTAKECDAKVKIAQIFASSSDKETDRKYDYAEKTLEYSIPSINKVSPKTLESTQYLKRQVEDVVFNKRQNENNPESSAQNPVDKMQTVNKKTKIIDINKYKGEQ